MTTRYVLYSANRSGAASVEVMLQALGLEFELRDATPWSNPPGSFFDELKTVNPLGQLPTLVAPGGEILTESVAVLWTLMERHPSEWVPAPSTRERAACLRWGVEPDSDVLAFEVSYQNVRADLKHLVSSA